MTIDDKIRDEKLEYDINRETVKISDLSSGKIDKYEFLTGEEILNPGEKREIEQTNFTYSPLGKTSKKQVKITEDQEEKQINAIEEHVKQLIKSSSEKESLTLSKQK